MQMATIESGTSLESAAPLDASTPMITEGCYAIIQKVGGEHTRVVRLTANTNVLIEKLRFEAESAIGHPFGIFEVIGKRLVPATVEDLKKRDGGDDIEMATLHDETLPNGGEKPVAPSAVVAETRQAITQEQITEMKEGGGKASDVVSKLIEGSASFAGRTAYSKSKYIRRKTKKHSDRVLILKPTIRLLSDTYLRKDHDRVGCLRIDQLAAVMHQGAIHTGRKVIVFDQVLGVFTAAVVERLAGSGACIHLHRHTVAQGIPCFNAMNFKPEVLSTFYPVRIDSVLHGWQLPPDGQEGTGDRKEEEKGKNGRPSTECDEDWKEAKEAASAAKKNERLQRESEGLAFVNGEGVETVLIATRSVDPVSLLEECWGKLKPAGNVVVYSPTLQHCARAQQWLRQKGAIHITLTDQLYRVHQVLPDRTHPLMSQMVVGGYILAAIKVIIPPVSAV